MIIIVILIAALLRFWQLTSVPPALDWDEVSNAYNGYSILLTGRDEFGQSFPILFRAYDGYVPPVLIYLNSISTLVFGLNEFASRIPNALLGTFTILGIFLLVKQISGNKSLAGLAAMLMAISPWHIGYSRVNFIASTPIFFVVLGIYFFVSSFNKKILAIFATISFIAAILSYFAAYVFVPLLVFALTLIYRKKIKVRDAILFIVPTILVAFLVLFVLGGGQNRYRGLSLFADPDLIKQSTLQAAGEGFLGRIIHNRRLVYFQKTLEGYVASFRGDLLFGKGDALERMVVPGEGFGLLLLWDLPFLIAGAFYLLKNKPDGWSLMFVWLLLAPVASSVTLPQPASTRITVMAPVLSIISAYGFWGLTRARFVTSRVMIILLAANLFLFLHQYFVHFPIEKSDKWFYGYRQLFNYLNNEENRGKKVHFIYGQPDQLDQAHMFLLFYNKIDPESWQSNGGTRLGCIGTTGQFSFERYDFIPYSCLTKPVDWESFTDNDLIVTSKLIDGSYNNKVEYLDGRDAFYIYEYGKVQDEISFEKGGTLLRREPPF